MEAATVQRRTQPAVKAPLTRNTRQEALIPLDVMRQTHVVVIGVGAVGHQIVQNVAAMGPKSLELVDFDTIELVNTGPQGWNEGDIGEYKVNAAAAMAVAKNPKLNVITRPVRFTDDIVRTWPTGGPVCVFIGVDDMDARKLIYEAVKSRATFVGETRIAEELIKVYAVKSPATDAEHEKTFFPQAEAYTGACAATAKMTMYNAQIAAGMVICQWVHSMNGKPVVPRTTLDLLSMDLFFDE